MTFAQLAAYRSGNTAEISRQKAHDVFVAGALTRREAGAREQIRNFRGRSKHGQAPDKPVTEETLRNHMALKCVRRCSH